MRLYTPVATISVEHSVLDENSTSYRFSTELSMNNSMIAMRKFLKELPSTKLVRIRECNHDPYDNLRYSISDVLIVQKMNVLIRRDELETLEDLTDKHFFCVTYGFPQARDELARILTHDFCIK